MANDKTLEESEKQENHYAVHLAEVNEKNDVVATQDIVNQNKLLVARQGTRINHDTANRIIQHKLLQPLEEQIRLKNLLESSQLREGFENLLHIPRFRNYKKLATCLRYRVYFGRYSETME